LPRQQGWDGPVLWQYARVQILIRIVVNGLAIWVAGALLDGVELAEDNSSLGHKIITVLLVGAIFGVVNAVIKPIVKLFSLPFYILTLGLFALVVNALMLEIASWISGKLDLSFHIDQFFWSAIVAAIIVSLVSLALNLVID
jgi:putative membrane protein